ncbi:hypothetical protein C497_14512 [Halalkalicoccus jeotgali B3]|uniref:Uncharacterized protein n=1 Tax=Halalkalicoccus jeotgali (strain DSM 18796 / CECT 7217 / JCM 14584 / KCTC 4019 / B3) TaxID=795797 RepID=L9VCP4_HALJB|nr:hypothetical protein C497_14512 [Halalkalicoccus jeotgali B3]
MYSVDVLLALGNEYNAEILGATDEPRSAQALSDELDIPIATCYRRLEQLGGRPPRTSRARPLGGPSPGQRLPAHRRPRRRGVRNGGVRRVRRGPGERDEQAG